MENFLDESLTEPLYHQKRFAELNERALALSGQLDGQVWSKRFIKDVIFDQNDEIFSSSRSLRQFHRFPDLDDFDETNNGDWNNIENPKVHQELLQNLPTEKDFSDGQEELRLQAEGLKQLKQHLKAFREGKFIVLEIAVEKQKTQYFYFKTERQLTDHFLKALGVEIETKPQALEA